MVLLHSYRHPEHEQWLGRALARALPDLHVSLSMRLSAPSASTSGPPPSRSTPRSRRCSLATCGAEPPAAGATRSPRRRSCSQRWPDRARDRRRPCRVDGALGTGRGCRRRRVRRPGCRGRRRALPGHGRDLVRRLRGRRWQRSQERGAGEIAGRPLALPMLAIHTVGAGGGSIAWRDGGGALRVGPRSAGAEPGPACYGRGGSEPTVTDANLLLGYLARRSAGGRGRLDRRAAERRSPAGRSSSAWSRWSAREGIVRIANAEMVRALRVVTVERGIDPRRYALLAFGGAGPLHAAGLPQELGIDAIDLPARLRRARRARPRRLPAPA